MFVLHLKPPPVSSVVIYASAYSPAESSATSASTSSSLSFTPRRRSIFTRRSRMVDPFSGVNSNAAPQPTIAPPRKAEIYVIAFISIRFLVVDHLLMHGSAAYY